MRRLRAIALTVLLAAGLAIGLCGCLTRSTAHNVGHYEAWHQGLRRIHEELDWALFEE